MEIQKLINDIKNLKGCKLAHIEYTSVVKLPKKLGITGTVTKFVSGSVQLNYNYQNAVNNRLEKSGESRDFVADKLPWGEWETPNKVILHKGNYYLRYYAHKNSGMQVTYFVDDRMTTTEELAIINTYNQSKVKGSAKQEAHGLNTEDQVIPRVLSFDAIEVLKCDDIDYMKYEEQNIA